MQCLGQYLPDSSLQYLIVWICLIFCKEAKGSGLCFLVFPDQIIFLVEISSGRKQKIDGNRILKVVTQGDIPLI